jgi:hypothetical protein
LQAGHCTVILTIKEFTGILIEARLIKSVFSPVGTALSVVGQRNMIRGMAVTASGKMHLKAITLFLATGRNREKTVVYPGANWLKDRQLRRPIV